MAAATAASASLRHPLTSPSHLTNPASNHHACRLRSPAASFRPVLSLKPLVNSRGRGLFSAFAASEDSKNSELEVEKPKNESEIKVEAAQEAWQQALEQFKADTIKMRAKTMEAYGIYSKKAAELLLETSEKLKIQADKAQKDLSVIAKEVGDESEQYLAMAAQNSPNAVKDIVETFRSLRTLNGVSEYKDYHVGIPYGTLLVAGGLLNFMLTGSIPAIRFGIILGAAILALGIASLRSSKAGQQSPLLVKGQAATSSIIFIRELSFCCQKGSLSTFFLVLISGAVVAFYIYRILTGGHKEGPSIEQTSEI